MRRQVFAVAALLALTAAPPARAQSAPMDELPQITLDAQFLDSADYFIAPGNLTWSGEFVAVGWRLALPSASLRGQLQFVVVGRGGGWVNGDRAWTNQFYQTRPATAQDLVVGKPVFVLNATENNVYRAPRSREETLAAGWWATTITDISGIARNEVRAGNARLSIGALRVLQ